MKCLVLLTINFITKMVGDSVLKIFKGFRTNHIQSYTNSILVHKDIVLGALLLDSRGSLGLESWLVEGVCEPELR